MKMRKIRFFAQLLSILLLISGYQGENDKEKKKAPSLNVIIDNLSPISHLISAITIQQEITQDPKIVIRVLSELLEVPSEDYFEKFQKIDTGGVAKNLRAFFEFLDQIPKPKINISELSISFKALEDLEKGAELLDSEEEDSEDPSSEFQQIVKEAQNFQGYEMNNTLSGFISRLNELKNIESIDMDSIYSSYIRPLYQYVSNIEKLLKRINTTIGNQNYTGVIEKIQKIQKSIDFLEKYAGNFDGFKNLEPRFTEVKEAIQMVENVTDRREEMADLAGDLKKVTLERVPVEKTLTLGFSGSLEQDLQNPVVPRLLARGNTTKVMELENRLLIFFNFTQKFKILNESFASSSTFNSSNLISTLISVADNKNNITDSLDSMKTCFQDIQKPEDLPDFKETRGLLERIAILSDRVIMINELMARKGERFLSFIIKWREILAEYERNSTEDQFRALIDKAKGIDNQSLAELDEFLKAYTDYPHDYAYQTVNWTVVVSGIIEALPGPLIRCLQPYNVSESVRFLANVEELRNSEFPGIQKYLTGIQKAQGVLAELLSSVKTRRRRQRSRISSHASMALARGIQVLQELSRILDTQKSILNAANAQNRLLSAVDKIGGLRGTDWSDKTRADMISMIRDLKQVEEDAGSLIFDSNSESSSHLKKLWEIFVIANIRGVQIGDKAYQMIAESLARHPDSRISNFAPDFENIGTLDLDFASHRTNLMEAYQSYQPIQEFFIDFFGFEKESEGSKDPEVVEGSEASVTISSSSLTPSSLNIFLIAGISGAVALLLLGLLIAYLITRKSSKNKFYHWGRDNERFWIYELFYEDDVFKALKEDRFGDAKALIKKGAYVDLFESYESSEGRSTIICTPLYAAVDLGNPRFVELLIRAGADKKAWSSDKKTPEEIVKDPEIQKIFQKYQNQKFQGSRGLLPVEKFNIWLGGQFQQEEEFQKDFEDLMDPKEPPTHVILPVDRDGVLDLDALGRDDKLIAIKMAVLVLSSPAILLKPSWMSECLKSRKNLYKDYNHRVTKLKYKNTIYATIDDWKKWSRKRAIPCLQNVELAYFTPEGKSPENQYLHQILKPLGASLMNLEDLIRDSSMRNTAPYWFPKINRHWILHRAGDERALERALEDPKFAEADLNTNFYIMMIDEFFEFLFSLKGWKSVSAVALETSSNVTTRGSTHRSRHDTTTMTEK